MKGDYLAYLAIGIVILLFIYLGVKEYNNMYYTHEATDYCYEKNIPVQENESCIKLRVIEQKKNEQ